MQEKDEHRDGKEAEGREGLDMGGISQCRGRKTLGSGPGHWDRLTSSAEKGRQVWEEGEPRLQIWGSAPSLCAEQRTFTVSAFYIQVLIQVVRAEATKLLKYQH